MLGLIIQVTIISIIFIFLVHHLISFLRETLTVPKMRDLVNKPNEKYKNIFDTINNDNSYINLGLSEESNIEDTLGTLISDKNGNLMKNELKSFLKKQLNSNGDSNIYSSNELSSTYSSIF
jgi:hypothetical protein